MRAIIRECYNGAVRCVMLESEAGLGKTALLSALCREPNSSEQDDESCSDNDYDVHVVRAEVSLFALYCGVIRRCRICRYCSAKENRWTSTTCSA